MNFCEECGNKLMPKDKFCENCGEAIAQASEKREVTLQQKQDLPPPPIQTQVESVYQHFHPESPVYGAQKKKSSAKIFIILGIILIFIIIIGVGIAGYFFFIKESKNIVEEVKKVEDKKESKTQIQEKEKTVTPSADEKKTTETQKEGFKKREKQTGDCGDYPELSERKLSPEELVGVSDKDKKYMKNDIYMRHGYIFTDEDLLLHFALFSCYEPKHLNVNRFLTDIEKYNIGLIKGNEKR